jgi:bacterioferritin
MKGDPKVIDYLNQALTNELTAINQYWLHYRVLDNWGLKKLAEYERHESIEEMQHADKLAERILFLEALPNFQAIHKLKGGRDGRGDSQGRSRAGARGYSAAQGSG